MKIKYKTVSFIGVLVLVVVAAGCIGMPSMSAGDIAQNMQVKYNTIKDYQGTVVLTTVINGKSKVTESDFKMKKPDKVLLINRETGSVVVSNGTTLWTYLPKTNEVMIMNISKREEPKIDFGTIINNITKRFNIKLLGTGKIAGRNTYILKLVPKNKTEKSLGTEKLWIDQKYWMPLKIEMNLTLFNNKTIQFTTFYKNLKFNTNMSDTNFQYIIPKGAKVVNLETLRFPKKMTLQEAQKEVNFTILTPSYLPEGYKFNHAMVLAFSKKSVILTYEKDDNNILLIQLSEEKGKLKKSLSGVKVVNIKPLPGAEVNINGNKGYCYSIKTINVLSWTSNNMVFVITSQLSKKDIEKIAESIK